MYDIALGYPYRPHRPSIGSGLPAATDPGPDRGQARVVKLSTATGWPLAAARFGRSTEDVLTGRNVSLPRVCTIDDSQDNSTSGKKN
jgi:hypothetical protein